MLETSLRLAATLNALSARRLNAPAAEARLRTGQPHHVADPDGLLGLDPLAGTPVRGALAQLEHRWGGTSWLLAAPRPGQLGGLRGPSGVNRAALEAGAVVVSHQPVFGGRCLAWVGEQVGHGVQWRLWAADQPVPSATPREASRALLAAIGQAEQALGRLDLAPAERPEVEAAPMLTSAYPATNQALADRAWLVLVVAESALAEQHRALSSHAVLNAERHLRELAGAARDALCSAASWPEQALQ